MRASGNEPPEAVVEGGMIDYTKLPEIRIAEALERLAAAHERVAAVLENGARKPKGVNLDKAYTEYRQMIERGELQHGHQDHPPRHRAVPVSAGAHRSGTGAGEPGRPAAGDGVPMTQPYLLRADACDDDIGFRVHNSRSIIIEGGYTCGFEIYCRACRATITGGFEMLFEEARGLVERHLDG